MQWVLVSAFISPVDNIPSAHFSAHTVCLLLQTLLFSWRKEKISQNTLPVEIIPLLAHISNQLEEYPQT